MALTFPRHIIVMLLYRVTLLHFFSLPRKPCKGGPSQHILEWKKTSIAQNTHDLISHNRKRKKTDYNRRTIFLQFCCKFIHCQKTIKMKKHSEETQTLRAGCSRAEPKKIRPAADSLPGARDGQNLISWRRSLPLPTNPVWWGSMHAISSYRGNRPINTPPAANPETGPITIYCAAASLLARSVMKHGLKKSYWENISGNILPHKYESLKAMTDVIIEWEDRRPRE